MHLSVKVVILLGDRVLLGMNPRGDWELLGGWPDRDDQSLIDTARREVKEEAGLDIGGLELINACLLRDSKVDDPVAIIAYGVALDEKYSNVMQSSSEHDSLKLFSLADIESSNRVLPDYKILILEYWMSKREG